MLLLPSTFVQNIKCSKSQSLIDNQENHDIIKKKGRLFKITAIIIVEQNSVYDHSDAGVKADKSGQLTENIFLQHSTYKEKCIKTKSKQLSDYCMTF